MHRPSIARALALSAAFIASIGAARTAAGMDSVSGWVRSGNTPIAGSNVHLYVAGPARGSKAVELGSSSTAPNGSFTIGYEQPDDDSAVLYLIADGPVPGVRLATALGNGSIPNTLTINERTTIAMAFAMAQFTEGSDIGGTSPGLQNAAAILRNLVNIKTGKVGAVLAKKPNGMETSTMRIFNALANILAGCVNGPVDCAVLFALATPPGGPVPTDTLQAAVNIARFPWQHNADLFALSYKQQTYAPALELPPITWTLALTYEGNGHEFDGPGLVAFDAKGNAWINNNYVFKHNHALPTCAGEQLIALSPTGEDLPGAPYVGGGLSGAGFGIMVDTIGGIWVANYGFYGEGCEDPPPANSVSRFTPDGQPVSGPEGYTQGGITAPQGIVADPSGNVWIANNCGPSVTQYRNGDPDDNWNLPLDTGARPFAIAIDLQGDAWVSDTGNSCVHHIASDGSRVGTALCGPDGGISRPMGIAVDSLGNVWVSNSAIVDVPCPDTGAADYGDLTPDFDHASVTMLDPDGVPTDDGPYQGAGVWIPWGIAIDGNDNVWVANFGGFRVSHFAGANPDGVPPGFQRGDPLGPNGYVSDALTRNTGISIDPSGNVWLCNNWLIDAVQTNPGGPSVTLFIGVAAPVETPLIGPPRQPGAGTACPADLTADGVVDGSDLGLLLGAWGGTGADLNADGTTDGADLGVLLAAWGSCDVR